ncbi:MAG: type I-D CRISPR-associated protein Cas10d/Csc3 [Acaryochloridaceae cyanobacterium RU_4_10]|nr:type I-D CRISPR-associated protein Cas10d/Csc3 [Acaryochloridaceae cyanobacterium RU_4_10]
MADELLQFLGIEDKPILTQFIEEIANKGLQIYQRVIQWGDHHGQSLYNHIISGVFLIYSLQELLQLEEVELKVITLAYCIHDLNKTYEGQEKSYGRIAKPEIIIKELEKIGVDGFFADWRDYVEDITELIRGHSGHNSVRGNSLDRRSDPTRLGKSRLIELDELIRAVDVSDLSHSYSERKHKQTFLSHFNSLSHKQYRLIAHQVSEQCGLLTNIIHNQVAEFISTRFNAMPVFLYPQGTHYLVPVENKINLTTKDCVLIGKSVERKIDQMKSDEYSKFIKAGNQGIKVDEELLKLGISCSEIFAQVDTIIQRKSYKPEEIEAKYKDKLRKSFSDEKESEKRIIQVWLEKDRIVSNSEDTMRLGELLRTFYIFLKKHCAKSLAEKNKSFREPWIYLYHLLEIHEVEQYIIFDPLYERAYIIAQSLSETHSYESLQKLVIQESNNLVKTEDVEEMEEGEATSNTTKEQALMNEEQTISPIVSYVSKNLSFDFTEFTVQSFAQNLERYLQNNHHQSCYASSAFETSKWMSGNVPRGIKVQQFSNRLIGGQREPKRYIDPVIREQFSIEKLNYDAGKEKIVYLHLMPYSFMTTPLIESFRRMFRKLKSIDVSAISLSVKEVIKFFNSNQSTYISLPVKPQKTLGLLLPKYSEVIGNVISIPLNPMGDNKTEKYLNAMEYALILHKCFGIKILLTELAIPILNLTEHIKTDIFLDGVPSTLRGLVTSDDLYFRRANEIAFGSGDVVWERLRSIREMYDLLWTDSKENEFVTMAQAFATSENSIFFIVDRLIEKRASFECKRSKKKVDKEVIARRLAKQLKPCMEKIINVGSHV